MKFSVLFLNFEDSKDQTNQVIDSKIEEKFGGGGSGNYVEKEPGKGLSTNDFTDALKEKVESSSRTVECTQSEYDNLSEEERKDTYFVITDSEGESELSEIDDSEISEDLTWSSDKISSELESKNDKIEIEADDTNFDDNTELLTHSTTTAFKRKKTSKLWDWIASKILSSTFMQSVLTNDATLKKYPVNSDAVTKALASYQAKVAAKGSVSQPVYTSNNGTFSTCNTYAGGTNVTLNGSSKGGSSASFYAPTTWGIPNQILKADGVYTSPQWVNIHSLLNAFHVRSGTINSLDKTINTLADLPKPIVREGSGIKAVWNFIILYARGTYSNKASGVYFLLRNLNAPESAYAYDVNNGQGGSITGVESTTGEILDTGYDSIFVCLLA